MNPGKGTHVESGQSLATSRAFELAMSCVREDDAQSIVLGCTGFLDVASRVGHLLGEALGTYVPIIAPNHAGFGFLVSLVRMRVLASLADLRSA